ncbi:MAG: phosphatase PAP2 family protein [Leucobacter sp.]|nr:phosphatase PAP2 family protein [Leucobacter sp.]
MSIPVASEAHRRLRVLWILLFWLIIGAGAYILGVLSSTGQAVEDNLLTASEFNPHPPAPLSLVSPFAIAVALIALGLVALWVHGIGRALTVTLVPAVAIVASQLLKSEVLGRPELLTLAAENSFPSGHMTVFATVVGAAVFAMPSRIRAVITAGGAVLLGVVSWQLLGYGWHRPSDVLGALALAVAGFAFITMFTRLDRPPRAWLLRTVSVGLVVAGWLAAGGALILTLIAWQSDNADRMLSAGQAGSIGLSLLAAHSLLRLAVLTYSPKAG